MYKIIDTHVHYDDDQFNEDRNDLLNRLNKEGIELVVNIGASIKSSQQTIQLTQQYPHVYGAVGVHPNETGELNEQNFQWLGQVARLPKIVAVGEIGLDYYWDEPEREIQKEWFIRQLQLAREVKKPVVIHSRDAASDTLEIMKRERAHEIGGVIHCFSYSVEMAREYLNMGYYLGIGGVVTFNNAKKLKEVVEYAPLDRIVLETDCPYLSPVPHRGKRNNSLYLSYVITEIAKLKNITEKMVIATTNHNAKILYRLEER
ncbi:MAG: TatD family hydrolase [Lachnospiraceae bacterium]